MTQNKKVKNDKKGRFKENDEKSKNKNDSIYDFTDWNFRYFSCRNFLNFNSEDSGYGGGGITCTLSVDKTNLKPTDTILNLTVTIENTTGKDLFGAQVDIQVDPEVFEVDAKVDAECGIIQSTDISNSYVDVNNSSLSTGKISLAGDDNYKAISKQRWVMAGYKLKVKKPASDFSSITMSNDLIPDMLGTQQEVTLVGSDIKIAFTPLSKECEMTNLTSTINEVKITKNENDFVATVPYSISTFDTASLRPTVSAGATVTYSPNGNVSLNEGDNTITMTVTAEDGTTNKQYSLVITRQAGENVNTLSSLTVKNNTNTLLSKTGAQLSSGTNDDLGTISYQDRGNISVSTAKNGNFSTVQIQLDNATKYTGNASETNKTLNLGMLTAGNHTVKVVVNSQTGTKTEYVITLNVQAPDTNNNLATMQLKMENGQVIELDKEFDPSVTSYSVTLPKGTSKVTVEATTQSQLSRVTGTGEHNVPGTIQITVTAEDGSTKVYTVTVTVEKDEPTPPNPDDNDPDKPNPDDPTTDETNSKVDLFPYILGLIILGANNILAFIIIVVMVAQRKKNENK